MAYKKNTDYRWLIDRAAEKGDFRKAALLEKSRNEKIRSEGMRYKPTSDYAGWLDKRDYSDEIRRTIDSGGSRREVAELLGSRIEKASSTKGMEKWKKDGVYNMAVDYITGQPENPYGGRLESLLASLESREPFSYNYKEDPLYKAYEEAYRNESRRAQENALGLASENTNGYASSYGVSAAAQAGRYYSIRQAEIIPQLYKLAYDVYQDETDTTFRELELLQGLQESQYDRYRDRAEDELRRQEAQYDREQDELDRQWRREQFLYEKERDNEKDRRYEEEWAYRKYRDGLKDSMRSSKGGRGGGGGKGSSVYAHSGHDERPEEKRPYSEDEKTLPKGKVRIFGLEGYFSRADAERLVLTGVAETFRHGRETMYKLKAVK